MRCIALPIGFDDVSVRKGGIDLSQCERITLMVTRRKSLMMVALKYPKLQS